MNAHGETIPRKRSGWCKLTISAMIPCVLGIFTIIFTLQQRDLSNRQRQQDRWQQLDSQREELFNSYINDISKFLMQESNNHSTINSNGLIYIRTKTLTILRTLDSERKKYIVLFLYVNGLIHDHGLDLRDADLNNVQLIGP